VLYAALTEIANSKPRLDIWVDQIEIDVDSGFVKTFVKLVSVTGP